ncbi:MAG TPA: hypothetical protein VIF09_26210 [Polyangiaceae bacterium]|jgi:hypothetical protein
METHTRRIAAAAYDRAQAARGRTDERVVLVGVELGPGDRRTLVGDVTLHGTPPEVLRVAVAETLAMLRVTWIALLGHEEGRDRRHLEAAHSALQCELAATEWTWASGTAEGHALGRTLARRRERLRGAVALPPPHGLGLLLPRESRASDPLPQSLVWACDRLDSLLAASGAHDTLLREVGYAAAGAWRLGEMEATSAALAVDACFERSTPELPAASEERPSLRAAS